MSINLELYKVFYVVASCGSLTKAARELGISQPAVSQSIKQLETQIGGRLLTRTGRGVELTYEGRMIYGYVEQANELFLTAESKFSQIKKLALGEIRIGASDTLTKHYLFPHIRAFTEQYPDLAIKLTNRTTGETLNYLRSGKVDVGFVNLPVEDAHHFEIRECMELHDVFVAGGRMVDDARRIKDYADLTRYPVLLLERPSNTRVCLDGALAKMGVRLTPTMELGSIDTLVDFAKGGLGITCVPREYILDELKEGALTEIEFPTALPTRAIGMATLKEVPLTFAVQQFVRSLGEDVE